MNQFKTIAFKDGSKSLDVRVSVEDGTIWLSKNEMATLFEHGTSTIWRHIKSTYNEFEIQGCSGYAKNARTLCKDGKYYNIPVYSEQVIKRIAERLNSDKYTKLSNYLRNNNVESEQQDNIIIYNNGSISLDVRISTKEDTVWLTQSQIATLFDITQQNVSLHIKNIFEEGELLDSSVHKDYLYTASDGKQYLTSVYNLDLILSIGYRTKGQRAIEFRKWASGVLRQYLIKGYAINENRIQSHSDILLNIESELLHFKQELQQLKNMFDCGQGKEQLFLNGQRFDAHEFFCSLMRQANKSIRIIDPYFDDKGLAILSKSKRIDRVIYLSHPGLLTKKDIVNFKSQYGDFKIKTIKNYHDRFIIIDDVECYHVGTSLNNAGAKTFVVIKLENPKIINIILNSIGV